MDLINYFRNNDSLYNCAIEALEKGDRSSALNYLSYIKPSWFSDIPKDKLISSFSRNKVFTSDLLDSIVERTHLIKSYAAQIVLHSVREYEQSFHSDDEKKLLQKVAEKYGINAACDFAYKNNICISKEIYNEFIEQMLSNSDYAGIADLCETLRKQAITFAGCDDTEMFGIAKHNKSYYVVHFAEMLKDSEIVLTEQCSFYNIYPAKYYAEYMSYLSDYYIAHQDPIVYLEVQ